MEAGKLAYALAYTLTFVMQVVTHLRCIDCTYIYILNRRAVVIVKQLTIFVYNRIYTYTLDVC